MKPFLLAYNDVIWQYESLIEILEIFTDPESNKMTFKWYITQFLSSKNLTLQTHVKSEYS